MRRLNAIASSLLTTVAVVAMGLTAGPAQAVAPPSGAVTAGDYCRTTALARNDDGYSDPVTLPFPVNFGGALQTTLYVNNNGNVTFGSGRSQYTPDDLTTATGWAIIAPFFADIDTRNVASAQTTYGSSPDGKVFCVNWVDVGYYSQHADKTNSIQLLLINRAGLPGGQPGDFDIQFNYDRITWETGDASGGSGGFGGTPAAAGYSFGTGAPGTFFQLTGSRTAGAFLDGGPNALVSGSRNSLGQPGRYVFFMRAGSGAGADLGGRVLDTNGAGVPGAFVQVCPVANPVPERCTTTQSGGGGAYAFVGIPVGELVITAFPPAGSGLRQGQVVTTLAAGEVKTVDVTLTVPGAMPQGTTITHVGMNANGVPVLNWNQQLTLTQDGCKDGVASYAITQGSATLASGPMTESPAGHYTAIVPPLYPHHGPATVSITIDCPNGPDEVTIFDVYIDPSGTVVDSTGQGVQGATVTLFRSDTPDGTFTAVPDGSAIMSPSNRTNPMLSGAGGIFGWDVVAGYYVVSAAAGSCTAQTPVMAVPPPQTGLTITLPCQLTPNAPAKLKAKAKGTKVKLTWKAPTGVDLTGYTVSVSKKNKKHFVTASSKVKGSARSYVWKKGKKGTKYYFQVAARSQWGVGKPSTIVKVKIR